MTSSPVLAIFASVFLTVAAEIPVRESQDAFDAFGATLMPILTELGVDPGTPMAMPVRNVIVG